MIGISKLYCGTVEPSDPLRYNRKTSQMPSHLLQFSMDKKPIVVWNVTRRCNLHCIHCYSQSNDERFPDELKTDFALKVIEDLAEFGVPVILFSGGEPLLREDIFTLIEAAVENGIRTAVSTNGTVISADFARKMKHLGVSYVGVSLDGIGGTNDSFRGRKGAFNMALEGIRNCQQIGLKVGLRFTITNRNYREIPEIFSLLENANIDRVCFYHLVYSGRGSKLRENDLSDIETRQVVDQIIDLTADMHRRGLKKEVLTVDNHTEG
ncbi:MAG: radical SAM protein, partial [Fidelibacterota bacterium]